MGGRGSSSLRCAMRRGTLSGTASEAKIRPAMTSPETIESVFTPEEQARRRAIIEAMLAERDSRVAAMSLDEVLRARDEGRA